MSYSKTHKPSECDKCLREVGEENLTPVPFIYLDLNDHMHEDVSEKYGYPKGTGYHHYKCCNKCINTC